MALESWVRWCVRTRRVRRSTITPCCSGDFTGTNRIVGRVTASQMASASAMSIFWRFR
nr:hypothetical protein [Caulobacter sp. UNC279MFTsu5.1]